MDGMECGKDPIFVPTLGTGTAVWLPRLSQLGSSKSSENLGARGSLTPWEHEDFEGPKHGGLVKMSLCLFSWAFSVSFRALYRCHVEVFTWPWPETSKHSQLGAATHFSSRKSGTNIVRIGRTKFPWNNHCRDPQLFCELMNFYRWLLIMSS